MLADHEPPAPQNSPESEPSKPSRAVLRKYGAFSRWSDRIMLLVVASVYAIPFMAIAGLPIITAKASTEFPATLGSPLILVVAYFGLRAYIRSLPLGEGRAVLVGLLIAPGWMYPMPEVVNMTLPEVMFALTLNTFVGFLIAWMVLRYLLPVLKQEP